MAQEITSPISFNSSDYATGASSSGAAGQRSAAGAEGGDSFLAALNNVRDGSTEDRIMDRPKLGNHEPFFPRKPMPYHAPDESEANTGKFSPTSSTARKSKAGDVERARGKDTGEVTSRRDDDNDDDRDDSYGMQTQAPADDRKGVLSKSYEGMAVSYPVRQIASQSLDEKTKDELQKKGLWNLPTMVMAQPSQKVLAMKTVVAMKNHGVPVQKPIAQFMASLESELGVTPDRLVRALQSLPPGQLQLPPQQTMIQVVKNLGLKGQDQVKALDLYAKMLAQMQILDDGQKAHAAPVMAGGLNGLNLEKQVETKVLQNAAHAQGGMNPRELAAKIAAQIQKQEGPSKSQHHGREGLLSFLKSSHSTGDQAPADSALKKLEVPGQGKGLNLVQGDASGNAQAQGQNLNSDQNQDQSQGQFVQYQSQAMAQSAAGREQAPVKEQVKFDVKHDVSAKPDSVNSTSGLDAKSLAMASGPMDVRGQAGPMAPAMPQVAGMDGKAHASAVRHEAIQTIVNNAQLLAHKGGGEMHLTLKPDHLGEIQLKVAMQGNHVNVQMLTDRGDVKKLIEQGVHELRHGLAQHNLSMDKLEVSVGDRNTGSFQQRQPDFAAARDFSHQQFNQNNGRREMMLGLSELRGSHAPRALNLGSAAHGSRATAVRSSGSGRLNVVA